MLREQRDQYTGACIVNLRKNREQYYGIIICFTSKCIVTNSICKNINQKYIVVLINKKKHSSLPVCHITITIIIQQNTIPIKLKIATDTNPTIKITYDPTIPMKKFKNNPKNNYCWNKQDYY